MTRFCSKEFLTLMVSNSGFLRLVFDFGFERQEIVYEKQNFLTGQFHDVKIERFDQGKKLILRSKIKTIHNLFSFSSLDIDLFNIILFFRA